MAPLQFLAAAMVAPLAVAAAASQMGPQTPRMPPPLRPPENIVAGGEAASTSSSPGRRLDHEKEERYEILPSAAILERMQKLVADFPTFATLTTTQEWFGLPRAGSDADCPFDSNYKVSGKGCNNYVLILQDKEAYPNDPDVQLSESAEYYLNQEGGWFKDGTDRSGWKYIPDVFLSGAVHGNERVGPTSLLEMAELLVEAAYCESLPRMRYHPSTATPSDGEDDKKWEQELATAKMCRRSLETDKGIPAHHRKWLARLVATRRTVIIPTANAQGYSVDKREEVGIDPNRDFPFDVENAADCMQTTAGRSINELFRSHLFPIGLTFHGGMEVIGYEWGAPTYLNKDAPDFNAQNAIGGAYSRYAGSFSGHQAYDFGTMNEKVYYVRGGMEDWAFAGSWDPERVIECQPTTFGGYPAEKTRYNNSTLRAFNMLVETSYPKAPARNELGKRGDPLVSGGGDGNGHIARNIRLALLGIDIVEPYVSIRGVGGLELEDDVVPGVNLRRYAGGSHFENSMIVWAPERFTRKTTISWTVGGAFDIDATELIVGPWNALPLNLADSNDGTYPSQEMIDSIDGLEEFVVTSPSNVETKRGSVEGRSRWHADGPHPAPGAAIDPTFEATIDITDYQPETTLVVLARAKVDKGWLEPANNVGPEGTGPTSHIVNARRNPSYFATNGGKVIRGKQDDWWYSRPVTIVMGVTEVKVLAEAESNGAPMKKDDGGQISAIHINSRRGYLSSIMSAVFRPEPRNRSVNRSVAPTKLSIPWMLGALGAVLILVLVVTLVRRRRRYAHRKRVKQMVEDEEGAFTIGSVYHDDPEDAEAGGYPEEEDSSIEIS